MKKGKFIIACFALCFTGFNVSAQEESQQLKIVRNMIDAVNQKDAAQYVEGVADTIKVYVDNVLRVEGREALQENRAKHFERYPETRSEIQHLVEIDQKVVMHDKVWLYSKDYQGQDIVEIFTFQDGRVVRMDVIQSQTLFKEK